MPSIAPITEQLQPSDHQFHFINGPYPSKSAAGLDLRYPDGPYYTWWTQSGATNIRAACEDLHQYFLQHTNDPYDGVVCFSRGCLLISSYIWYHQTRAPDVPLPFKAVVFICGGPALSVLEELGASISDTAHEWDRRTKIALRERASKDAILKWGKARWLTPGANGDSDLGLDPLAQVEDCDVFGLDITQVQQTLRITIPTVHVYGRVDPRLPASMQLIHLCDPEKRFVCQHNGGHNIPRNAESAGKIAQCIEQCSELITRGC